jgi:hypothetical protein
VEGVSRNSEVRDSVAVLRAAAGRDPYDKALSDMVTPPAGAESRR